jgi:hypothetical protein
MNETPHVIVYTDHDLAHNSFWDSLLIREAVRGSITLEFKKRFFFKSLSRLFTTYTEVFTGESIKRIVVDFHDNYNFIAHDNLDVCDIYYKVNYRQGFVSTLLPQNQKKVKPFIPHFTVAGEQNVSIYSRMLGSWAERINYYSLLKPANFNVKKVLYQAGPSRLKRYRTFVKFSDSEKYVSIKPIRDRIFFIASLYVENSDEKREVNGRRINLVKSLKQEYGSYFYGGIVNSEVAKRMCPDLIFQDYLPHSRYLEECKRSDICVYSNGPNNCLSWKLGEYIWLGKPVVLERLFISFDNSFNSSQHVIEASDQFQILSKIELLRNDHEAKKDFSNLNSEFYNKLIILPLISS